MSVPVLLTVFNRPKQTRASIHAIIRTRPRAVYVMGDGPRRNEPADIELVQQVWDEIHSAQWPCPVFELQSEVNLGCKSAIMTGVSWILGEQERALVIEDDVVINPEAMPLAEAMLNEGALSDDVGSISLFSAVPRRYLTHPADTYRRSIYCSSQVWGTWPDKWEGMRSSFEDWRTWLPPTRLQEIGGQRFRRFWTRKFDDLHSREVPTWDYLWLASHWSLNRYALVTNKNYCINIGFEEGATFSLERPRWFPTQYHSWTPPIAHSCSSNHDQRADAWTSRNQVGISVIKQAKWMIDRRWPQIRRLYIRLRSAFGTFGDSR